MGKYDDACVRGLSSVSVSKSIIIKRIRRAMGNVWGTRRLTAFVLPIFVLSVLATARAERHGRPEGSLSPSTAYAVSVVAQISHAVGIDAPTPIFRAPVNAAHAVFVDGHEAIVYNPRFLDALNHRAGTNWAAVSVIAHELGHHYYSHSHLQVDELPPDVVREHELEADYFSGFVLERMGASLSEAEAGQHALFVRDESSTHPESSRRLVAIAIGYSDGGAERAPAADPASRIALAMRLATRGSSHAREAARIRERDFPSGPW